jgi:uncharacterized protein YecE (DUF72 family)
LDIYFCPFFQTPTTFEQNFPPFSAFGKILQNEHFLIKNRKNVKIKKNTEEKILAAQNYNIWLYIINNDRNR